MPEYYLREDLAGEVSPGGLLGWAKKVASQAEARDVYRNKEGRKTLRFERAGRPYFLKLHLGIGWGEVIKNLLQLRLPILGARDEYLAINALHEIGVDTMSVAAYTSLGINPAAIQSLIITDELTGTVSLEDYCAKWGRTPPDSGLKRRLIEKVADSARRMHEAGINHRDFYLCHFHLDEESLAGRDIRCFLIDLHRAQRRSRVPRRWLVKDLAGLYFSAMDCGLGQRDLLRFIRHYSGTDLRVALRDSAGLWQQVSLGAKKLYRKEHGMDAPSLGPGL